MMEHFGVKIDVSTTDSVYSEPTKNWTMQVSDTSVREVQEAREDEGVRARDDISIRMENAVSGLTSALGEGLQRVRTGISVMTEEESFTTLTTQEEKTTVEELGAGSKEATSQSIDDNTSMSESLSYWTPVLAKEDNEEDDVEVISPNTVQEKKKSVIDQLQYLADILSSEDAFDQICSHIEVSLGVKEHLNQDYFVETDIKDLTLHVEGPPEKMNLLSNVNANLGLHLGIKKGHFVISKVDKGSKLDLIGFKPGMRILRINGEKPRSISHIKDEMKTKIEAESKNGDLKREVVFGVNDDYDLRMSRDNTTKSIYITTVKKGSKLDLAGFK